MLIDTFLKGIIVGLSVSVPLGPIGMLVIQRTLTRGRKYGVVTGLGATTSDLIYTGIVMFSLSFIIGFLENNRLIIQTIGSLIVLMFGIFIFKSNPVALPKIQERASVHSASSDFFTSFFLTLSNPLIIFVLIALFAQFEFVSSNSGTLNYFVGYFGIFSGALSWWLLLTVIIHKSRNALNRGGLKMVNQVTGTIIMIIGVFSLIYSILK